MVGCKAKKWGRYHTAVRNSPDGRLLGDGLLPTHPTSSNSVFYTFDPSGNTCQRLNAGGGVDYSHLTSRFGVQRVHDGMSETYGGFGAQ